jgi:hypothetical protein
LYFYMNKCQKLRRILLVEGSCTLIFFSLYINRNVNTDVIRSWKREIRIRTAMLCTGPQTQVSLDSSLKSPVANLATSVVAIPVPNL